MRTEHIKDYLWSEMIPSIDNKRLLNNCLIIEKFLEGRIDQDQTKKKWGDMAYGTLTGKGFFQYNIFTFPSTELIKLFGEMRKAIVPILNPKETYVIQSWLNVYRENGFIDWHGHWAKETHTIHGFYCVNTEDVPSYTDYKFPHIGEEVTTVHSKDGLLVYGKSEDDLHRSSPGWNSKTPRITIAFDIIPAAVLQDRHKQDFLASYPHNHYFPFI